MLDRRHRTRFGATFWSLLIAHDISADTLAPLVEKLTIFVLENP